MSRKKSIRKYTVTAMAASAAFASVAPIAASADTAGFPDVSKTNDHYENIMKLSKQGVIQGYQDGKFGPYDSISRGQVAAMLANALNLETPKNVDKVLERYSDVKAGDRYADEIAAVTEAGVFAGTSDGNFNKYNDMSRQQMATVLVDGFKLKDYDNGKDVDVNLDKVSESHVANVQILANLGITEALNDYRGYEDVSRAQFSTFLVKSMDLTEELEVNTINAVKDQTVDSSTDEKQFLKFTVNDGKEVSIEDLEGAGYSVEFLSSNKGVLADTATGELKNSALDKDFTYQVRVSKGDKVINTSAKETVKVENFAETITEITKVVPVVEEQEKSSYTLTAENKVTFNVYGYKKDDPETEVLLNDYSHTVKTSDDTVLYVYPDNTAAALKAGKATVTVKAGDKELTQDIRVVSAEEAPKADSLTADVESIKTAVGSDGETVKVTVKDQYGDALQNQTVATEFKEADIATVTDDIRTDAKGEAEFTVAGSKEGTTNLKLTVGEKTLDIPVEVQAVGDLDHALLKGEETFNLADSATQEYTLQGYDDKDLPVGNAIELPTSEDGDTYYKVETSDENVAEASIDSNKVVVTGKKDGKVTVTLSKYEGTLDSPSETYTKEVTIEDSRAMLTDVTFTDEKPEFTSEITTADLTDVIKDFTFAPTTTAYKFEQDSEDASIINIVDTNDEVTNNVLGTIDVKTLNDSNLETTISPKGDKDATITVAVKEGKEEADNKQGPVSLTVKDANGNLVKDVSLTADLNK